MSVTLLRVQAPDSDENIEERNDQKIIVSLPVVLGRGSLLKCGEKKVSRRHAYLDWEDDGVLLTSVHQNPTFTVTKGGEKQLTEGSSTLLTHGDKFGLMEASFWYKVCIPDIVTKDAEKAEESVVPSCTTNLAAPTEEAEERKKGKETNSGKKCAELKEDLLQSDKENKGVIKVQSNKKACMTTKEDRVQETSVTKECTRLETDVLVPKRKDSTTCTPIMNEVAPIISQQEIQSSVLPRKRKLPAWMTKESSTKTDGATAGTTHHSHGGSRKTHSTPSRKKRTSDFSNQSEMSEEKFSVADTSKLQSPTKKEKCDEQADHGNHESKREKLKPSASTPKRKGGSTSPKKAQNQREKTTGSLLKQGNKKQHDMSDESSEGDVEDNESTSYEVSKTKSPNRGGKKHRTSPVKPPISDEEDTNSEDDLVSNVATSTTHTNQTSSPARTTRPATTSKDTPRPSCNYGANCYRKNPQHRSSFAHPGDTDYQAAVSDGESSGDERPECEFGVDCYRKNLQHRRQYRHTRYPQPQRKAKRKARQKKARLGSDSEDDYDYDDPFLDDGSTDDYAPTDSSSDSATEPSQDAMEEDTTRMLKEGKKFVRRR